MKTTISAIHYNKNPKTKVYTLEKVKKLAKFHPKIQEAHVRLFSEKAHRGEEHDFYCEIEIAVPGRIITIIDTEREIDKAIDKAVERMRRTLTKHKEKDITKKHREGLKTKRSARRLS